MASIYIKSEIDGNTYSYTNGQFARHLRANNMTHQDYYDKYLLVGNNTCPYCNERPRTFQSVNNGYRKSCSKQACRNKVTSEAHLNRSPEAIAKSNAIRAQTCLKEYGVPFAAQTEEARKRNSERMFEVKECGRMEHEIQQERRHKACLEKYGNATYNNNSKISETKMAFTDEKNVTINEKRIETMLERYGVHYSLEIPSVVERMAANTGRANSTFKSYVLPSGIEMKVRGFEPQVLDILLEKYDESDIAIQSSSFHISERPAVIHYNYDNKDRRYFPDFYIKSENKIIEVKSEWWYSGNGSERYKDRYLMNKAKEEASVKAGFAYELWLFDKRNNLTVITM